MITLRFPTQIEWENHGGPVIRVMLATGNEAIIDDECILVFDETQGAWKINPSLNEGMSGFRLLPNGKMEPGYVVVEIAGIKLADPLWITPGDWKFWVKDGFEKEPFKEAILAINSPGSGYEVLTPSVMKQLGAVNVGGGKNNIFVLSDGRYAV